MFLDSLDAFQIVVDSACCILTNIHYECKMPENELYTQNKIVTLCLWRPSPTLFESPGRLNENLNEFVENHNKILMKSKLLVFCVGSFPNKTET